MKLILHMLRWALVLMVTLVTLLLMVASWEVMTDDLARAALPDWLLPVGALVDLAALALLCFWPKEGK
jgi:hypothetical protein